MSWFRLDDKGAFHAKVVAVGNEAYGAWVRAGQWSCDHGTDGFVPMAIAITIAPFAIWQTLANALLLDATDRDGIQIHDFLDYNPSAKESKRRNGKLSQARAIAGKRGAEKRWQTDSKAMANVMANERQADSKTMAPYPIPIPSRTQEKKQEIPTIDSAEVKSPQLFPDDVVPPAGPNARSIFDQFQDIRSRYLPKAKRQVFSPDRARKIEQALASHGADDVVAALHGYFLDPFHQSIQFGKADVEFILRNARHIEQFRDHQLRHASAASKRERSAAEKAEREAADRAEVMAKLEGWAREAGAASFEEYASGAMAAVSSRLQGSDDADPFDLAFDVFMGQPGAAT